MLSAVNSSFSLFNMLSCLESEYGSPLLSAAWTPDAGWCLEGGRTYIAALQSGYTVACWKGCEEESSFLVHSYFRTIALVSIRHWLLLSSLGSRTLKSGWGHPYNSYGTPQNEVMTAIVPDTDRIISIC